jgi:hypothetical protein
MKHLLDMKFFNCLSPQSASGGAFANNNAVDTSGIIDLLFLIETGALAAAVGSGGAADALKIEECDTVNGSYTDVADAVLSSAIADTKDNKMYAIYVNLCKSHKRFMRVNAPTAGAGACLLSIKAITVPAYPTLTAADMGLEEFIEA